jgi:hypothetical protein
MTEDRVEGRKTYEGCLQELKTGFILKGFKSTEFAVFSLALDCEATQGRAMEASRRNDEAGESSYFADSMVRRYWLAHNAAREKAELVIKAVPCLADSYSEATELIKDAFSTCREENPGKTFPENEAITQLEMWRDHVVGNVADTSLGNFCPKQ